MEHIDKPILNENTKIFNLFQLSFIRNYIEYEYCDLIHFAIAHKKTNLLNRIFAEKINWLDSSLNLVTETWMVTITLCCLCWR